MAHLTPLFSGDEALRAENIDRMVRQATTKKFVMKQVVMTSRSKSWQETYYRESARRVGSGTTGLPANVEGIPRMAAFPSDAPDYERISNYQKKHGLETDISWEDALSDNIDIVQRTIENLSTGVAFSVDRDIYDTLNATGINTLAIAGGAEWDTATRASRVPHEQLARAGALIMDNALKHYRPDTVLVNPTDWAYLATNDFIMDSFDASGPAVMKGGPGVVGTLMGWKVIADPVVPTDEAYVLQSKICATYRVLQDIQTIVKKEEFIKWTIRVAEIGVPFVTDPLAITRLTNTRA